jgi:hypothetical protein
VWVLALLGEGNESLELASNIVRYLFTFIPSFPMVRSIMAIAQVKNQSSVITKTKPCS